jgi:hypothetical protein
MIALTACNQDPVTVAAVGGRVELVPAPATGELAEYVAQEVARGSHDHVPVVVYVGATWCEPCRDFHAAAERGALDASLGPMRFLEFDLDRDGDRLTAAGYSSALVPLFARPLADGRASGTQTDGVRKGGKYVEQLTPRIKALFGT